MLITYEQKATQSSYTSQNDHKSKGYPSKTSADNCQIGQLSVGQLSVGHGQLSEKTVSALKKL